MTDETRSDDDRLAYRLAAYEAAPGDETANELDPADPMHGRLRHGIAGLNLARHLRPTPETSEEPAPGLPWSSLGRFQLQREVGRGGCGVVYLAHDPLLNRDVALKVPRAEVAVTPELRERFQREARAAARLDHPNLVPVFETGAIGPVIFIASAYCAGLNLAQWLKGQRGLTPVRPACGLIACLAGAIQHAHDRGVLHRDLKPSNILLQPVVKGRWPEPEAAESTSPALTAPLISFYPKITDFGLAKFLQEGMKAAQTYTGVIGTPNYMAPEQAAGRAGEVGPATDVYALGAILYELLTGRPPILGETDLDTLRRARSEEPIAPRRLRPDLPADLDTICLKCLEKEPARRYCGAALLAEDMQRFLAGRPIQARPPSTLNRVFRWLGRNPALAATSLVAVAAIVLALVLGVGFAFARQEAQAAEQLRREQTQTQTALVEAHTQRQLAMEASARLALERGRTLCQQGDTAHGLLWLAHSLALTPAGHPELDHAIRAHVAGWRRQLRPLRNVISHPEGVTCMALSPDGRTGASGSLDGSVLLWEVATGRVLHSLPRHPYDIEALQFLPDGVSLVTSCDGTCRFWDVSTGKPTGIVSVDPVSIFHLAFSPDGRTFAAGGVNGYLRIRDTATAAVLAAPPGPENLETCALDFSPDGRYLVTANGQMAVLRDARTGEQLGIAGRYEGYRTSLIVCRDGRSLLLTDFHGGTQRWDLHTGKTLGPPLRHAGVINRVAVSPDSNWIATAGEDGSARVWRFETGEPQGPSLPHPMPLSDVAFSPDGQLVATACQDGMARIWDAKSGRLASPPLAHRDRVQRLAFSATGPTLATASLDGTVRLWDLNVSPLSLALPHEGPVEAAAFRPDGKLVATGSHDSTVRLWDAGTGEPQGPPLRHSGHVQTLAFSPDGRTVGVGGRGGTRLWQPDTGRVLEQLLAPSDGVFCVAFSPNGRLFVSGEANYRARMWRVDNGEPVGPELPHRHAVRSLAFSPNGKWLASGDRGGGLQIWKAETGRPEGLLLKHQDAVDSLAFSDDSRLLAAASHDGTARMWRVPTGEPAGPVLAHDGRVLALAIDREGRRLATASADFRARLWDVTSGQLLTPPMTHPQAVQGVAFRPDGKVLATACVDGAVRLWEVNSGKPLGMPLAHGGPVVQVLFSPDGRTILTAGRDHAAQLWSPPDAIAGTVDRIQVWAEVLTGERLDEEGGAQVLDADAWEQRRQRLNALGGPPSSWESL